MLLASEEKRDQVVQPLSVRNLGVHAQQGFPARAHKCRRKVGGRAEAYIVVIAESVILIIICHHVIILQCTQFVRPVYNTLLSAAP